ncbi:MAG: alpha/beta fold hydrolase [Betaproteobacteria bacterium]|nr:alpha/beta fold hydrolase [Betaproteobacteria bacterium]MSQ88995.1 alpha/beta fold hydrolase [Betaproteobacteria bacterium]
MTPLVFLHGLGGGHHAWEQQLPYFGGLGYPSHAWDQPGYGHSQSVEPYDLEQVSAALARLIQELSGEPVVLIGHSMGGLIAQETYVRHPKLIKALVLCFTSPAFAHGGSDFATQFIAARLAPLDQGKTMAEIAAQLMPTLGSNSRLAEKIMASVPAQTYRLAVHLLTTFDRRKELARIRAPTLVIAGSDDKIAPPAMMARMAQKIPGAQYVLLGGCGHLGPMDQPVAFNAAVLAFLQHHGL